MSDLPLTPSTARSAKPYTYADVFVADDRSIDEPLQSRPQTISNGPTTGGTLWQNPDLGRVVRPSIRPVESAAIPAATTVAFGRRE